MNSKISIAAAIAAALPARRIITRGVIDMATSEILESEGYLYSGPMALADESSDAQLAAITKSIADIGDLAKASGAKVETEIGKLTTQTKELGTRVLDLEQKNATLLANPALRGAGGGETLPNIGKLICGDDKFAALRSGNAQRANIEIKQALRTVIKSVLTNTGQSADSPQVNFPSVSQFLAPTPQQAPGRRLLVLQALQHLPVSAASVTVPMVSSTTDGAAPQSHEGSAKAESVISVTGDAMSLPAIATYLNLSKQVWADIAALPAFLQSWLSFFVLRKLESLIISGNGTSDKILGLINAGTQYIPVEDHGIDRVAEACVVGLPFYGYSPTLIILNSVDYMRTLTQRDANGRYVGAGWEAGFNTSLWGTPAVASPGCPAGTAIVLDGALVSILDREEINMQVGYTGSQFTENQATLLCEGRWNLAVNDPHAIMVVPLPVNSPNTVG